LPQQFFNLHIHFLHTFILFKNTLLEAMKPDVIANIERLIPQLLMLSYAVCQL
jgi:hypothetical protein